MFLDAVGHWYNECSVSLMEYRCLGQKLRSADVVRRGDLAAGSFSDGHFTFHCHIITPKSSLYNLDINVHY